MYQDEFIKELSKYHRLGNLTHVMLGLRLAIESSQTPPEDQIRLHASKDKLYVIPASFMVPKGSPLNVNLPHTSAYSI